MGRYDPSPLTLSISKDATQVWPNRKTVDDGWRGDAAHQARKSDHNIGDAVDVTHDAASGASGDVIAAVAIRDPRVKYVIWNRRVYDKREGPTPGWQPYSKWRELPHEEHVHISIYRAARADTSPMAFSQADLPPINMPGERRFEDADPKLGAQKEAKRKAKAEARKAKSKSSSKKTSDATRAGVHIYDGEATLMLGTKQWMAALVESPHTGGGRVAQGSSTVFVGTQQLPFARQSDPTTDGRFIIDGQPDILIG